MSQRHPKRQELLDRNTKEEAFCRQCRASLVLGVGLFWCMLVGRYLLRDGFGPADLITGVFAFSFALFLVFLTITFFRMQLSCLNEIATEIILETLNLDDLGKFIIAKHSEMEKNASRLFLSIFKAIFDLVKNWFQRMTRHGPKAFFLG
jgi:hypothetical protein